MFVDRLMREKTHGVIPSGWEIVLLDRVAERGSGHTPDKKVPSYWDGGIKWVSLKDCDKLDHTYIGDTGERISAAGLANSSAVLHPTGTVILSRDAGVGKSAILMDEMAVSQHFIAWRCGDRLDNHYLYQWLQLMKPEFERVAVGSTIITIGLPYFRKLRILLPPPAEQRAIAALLGTWDRAIEQTSQLIEAKRRMMDGLAQHLLVNHRSAGTCSPWPRRPAGELFESVSRRRRQGGALLSVTQDSGIVRRDQLDGRVAMPSGTTSGFKAVEPGDFVISLRTFQGGIEYSTVSGLVSPAYTVVRPQVKLEPRFYRHYFKSREFIGRLAVAVIGIRDGKQISYDDFRALRVPEPPPAQQEKIADMLDAADAEIRQLVGLLSALQAQKRALADKLLTGQIRQSVPEES